MTAVSLLSNKIKLKITLPRRVLRQTFKHVSFSPHPTFQGSFLARGLKTRPVGKKLWGLQTEGRACDEEEEKGEEERARQMTCWRFVCLLKSAVLSLALYKPTLARRPDSLFSPCRKPFCKTLPAAAFGGRCLGLEQNSLFKTWFK